MNPAARAALRTLLTSDPQFIADLQALGLGKGGEPAVPKVLDGNRRFEQVGQEHYPCWLNDAGDMVAEDAGNEGGGLDGLSIGSTQQDWGGDIELSLLWHQQDYATSVAQTDTIPAALVRLLLRNPSLAESCTLARVVEVLTDRGYRHPTHYLYARIRVNTTIERDA